MKLFVLDLMNLAYRAYFGNPGLKTAAGHPTSMCYGVAIGVLKLLKEYKPDYLVFATDAKGKTFRHDMYDGYKAGRQQQPDDFQYQLNDLFRLINAWGFPVIGCPGYEADDVIGTIAKNFAGYPVQPTQDHPLEGLEIVIVSGDKDMMQLVGDHVSLLRVTNDGYKTVNGQGVFEKFGCRPDQVVDCLAIIGDTSDAVPGVKGIGEKGAAKLIGTYGSLQGVYDNLQQIPTKIAAKLQLSKDMAFLSKSLVQIVTEVPLDLQLSDCEASRALDYRPELDKVFQELEFYSLLDPRG